MLCVEDRTKREVFGPNPTGVYAGRLAALLLLVTKTEEGRGGKSLRPFKQGDKD